MNAFGDTGGRPPDDGGVVVDMGGSVVAPMDAIEEPDGGITLIQVEPDDTKPAAGHNENLADYLEETYLSEIAQKVIEGVRVDRESRKPWADTISEAMSYLGINFETRDFPFPGASAVVDMMIMEAALRNQAQTCAELMPATGPVKSQIIGIPTENTEERATRTKDFFNWFLMEGSPGWVEEKERLFLWRALAGSVFSKVYQDPIKNRPVSPFLTSDDVVVSYFADSEMESVPRVTHILGLTYREMRERQISGFYSDIELVTPENPEQTVIGQKVDNLVGVTKPTPDEADKINFDFEVFEQHVDMVLKGYEAKSADGEILDLPTPFIITVDRTSRKVLGIRKNWREGDASYEKIQYFVHWKLLPGLGFYGLGFLHILGNPAKTATALQRQMIDAETLSMFPGGMRVKGMRMDDNNKMIGPCEWIEIDTGGLPISQAIAPMPYKGASEVSLALWDKGRQNAQNVGNMADISVGDGRQDAPVGTTLALLEAANRMMSATIKSAHRSLKKEFKLFAALFGQYLPETPYPFPVPGGQQAIMRADFSDEIDVIPVSDPNITSYAQRVTRAEAMLRFALQAPEIHDKRAAFKNMYVEMGVDERKIEAILPPPQQAVPSDPLTENQMALTGKPVAVGQWQDHQAHIKAHQVLADQVPNLAAHISEHLAAAMRVNVEKLLGITLPPAGTKLPPQVENQLAVLVAQALDKLNTPQGAEPTPGQIAMAEIQVEAQKVSAIIQKINADTATKAFEAQQKYLTSEKDRQERMANAAADRQSRAQIELMKAQNKNSIGSSRRSFN